MYSNKDLITLNEVQNDGKTIHLYFNTEIGLYVAGSTWLTVSVLSLLHILWT